jgi:acetyltransferase-like isoleucine patch superfamily enzyme
MLLKIISLFLPWNLKRHFLKIFFSYELHPQAHIGLAWIFPRELSMAAGARIDHFTVAIHLDRIEMKENSSIGRSNWITGFSSNNNSLHFKHQVDRCSELLMGISSAITKNHHLDCTSLIEVGQYSTIAGYNSQLLTHSINVIDNRQDSKPIQIGEYTFVGTNVVILGGSTLPPYSVLGAKSLLNKTYTEEWKLYAGVPAKEISDIPRDAKYFSRTEGFVY